MLKLSLLLLSLLSFSCNCEKKAVEQTNKEMINQDFPISEIYYQSWVAGVRGGGSGIDVHVEFTNELPKDTELKEVQLLNYTSYKVENTEKTKYIARIKTEANEMVLAENPKDEYGNQTPIKKENSLKKGDVLLIFEKNGDTFTQLVENVKEVEMLAYPFAKPRN